MGLFDKKTCDICGGKIGMLGNKKLEDGNMCKDCAKKLSPWFTDRKKSTVADINAQLEYREQNKNAVNTFNITRTIGNNTKLLIDDNNRKWTVGSGSNPLSNYPDILDFSQAGSCELDINESRSEMYQEINGERTSYNPPRYEYSYDFDATIRVVGNPYFDEIPFSISNGYVHTGERNMGGGTATSGWNVNSRSFGNDFETREYYDCINIGNELKQAIDNMRNMGGGMNNMNPGMGMNNQGMNQSMMNNQGMNQGMMSNLGMNQGMMNNLGMNQGMMNNQGMKQGMMNNQGMNQGSGTCPYCGAPVSGKFCGNCGASL